MKALRIILLGILTIFVTLYVAFLFVLPNAINLNKYSPQITKAIQDSTGFKVNISGLKIKTAWNLSAGALIEKTDLSYPTGKKFAQINNLQVRLSLLPMLLWQIEVDKVSVDKIMLNLDVKKDGKFLIEDYLPKNRTKTAQKQPLKFSHNMPAIFAKKYRVSFIDLETNKKYSLKGSDLKVSDFVLNKKIKLKTNGALILNNRKQVTYNVALFSKVFSQEKEQENPRINIIKTFEDIYKYDFQANIDANLKLTGQPKGIQTDGKISVNNATITLNGTAFPPSRLIMDFKGDKVKIDSTIYADTDCKATIKGLVKNGNHKSVDLHVISDKIELNHALVLANTFFKTIGKKDLEGASASGLLKADFDIKSDFKKIQSNGFLKIENANITIRQYKTSVHNINADVDFSQDAIKIKKASARFDNQPLTVKGIIDKNANADITILANNLQLKSFLLSTGNTNLLKDNDIQGSLALKAYIKGRLDKAEPKVNIIANNIRVLNKSSKMQVKLAKAIVNLSSGKKTKGSAQIVNLKVYQNGSTLASSPGLILSFDNNQLKINKSYLYINGIRTNLEGKISGLSSTPRLNPISISVPNQVSLPIAGYPGSNIVLKGNIKLSGNPENPQIQGGFNIPLIRIPSMSLSAKNAVLSLDKEFSINCPQIHIANSSMSFSSRINKDFSNGLILKNADFASSYIDLDSIGKAMSNTPKGTNSNLPVTIFSGKATIDKFKTGNIIATNITSGLALKNNILALENINANAYSGKTKGQISYNLQNGKIGINLQGRGLSANTALIALTGRNDKIIGVMDFDSNISMKGSSSNEILNSLKGTTNFIIHNGQMGVLGKFEHLLYAQNILSNNVFKATLNIIAKALTVKNTGVYKYMKGKISFSDGWANIIWIKTSGPSMSLYMTGRYYLPGSTANLTILGRISDDIVRILGPIGEFSMDKAISSIPKLGEITSFFVSQFTVNPNYENIDSIPDLYPKTEFGTKEFKVVIDGDIQRQNSVKSFKWISRPRVSQTQAQTKVSTPTINPYTMKKQYQTTVKSYQDSAQQQYNGIKKQIPTSVPDFVNKLPNLQN